MLYPGRYRVITTAPVEWQGLRYEWDVTVTVRPGIPILDLTQANATKIVQVPDGNSDAARVVRVPR
jgi:hypothetical protein